MSAGVRLALGIVLIGIAAFVGVTAPAVNGQTLIAMGILAVGGYFAMTSVVHS
jgi:hypothetical protein